MYNCSIGASAIHAGLILKCVTIKNIMEYYKFNKDVYVVKGANKHCIYNLGNGNLYNINEKVLDLINNLVNEKNFYLTLKKNERKIVNELISANLLMQSHTKVPIVDILSLRKKQSYEFCWIEVTKQCNLSCIFCYEKSNPFCTEKISIDKFCYVCNELKEIGINRVQLIGGEPMLLKDELKFMLEYCCFTFDFVEVYTNGTLINEEWAKYFAKYNIKIALSMHSYIPMEHDRITTVKDSYKKVLRGLELLKKYKVKYQLGAVKNASCNVGDKPKNLEDTLKPKNPKIVGRANLSQYNLEMFQEKAITKISKRTKVNKNMVIAALSGHQCFARNLYITCKLEVYPCVMERRISHGDLNNNKLQVILNNKVKFLSKDHIKECKDCEFRYACFDCRPDSNGKDLYQKPWYCTYSPRQGKWRNIEDVWQNIRGEATVYKVKL